LRNGGQASRYQHVEAGVNSRLDEMQAAILRARLPFLPAWTARRRHLAARYRTALAGTPLVVASEADPGHVYHLFTVCADARDALQAHLAAAGIGTLVHYPLTVARQTAFADLPPSSCPEADRLTARVLSLPLYPALTDATVDEIASAVSRFQAPADSVAARR
jgi:dTDP-4-amino-4,6-dideoxygalactose transaminase